MIAPGTVLLHDNLAPDGTSLLFEAPLRVLQAHDAAGARRALAGLEAARAEGLWAAGFLAYELGLAFEERLAPLLEPQGAVPLFWLGLYHAPRRLTPEEAEAWLAAAAEGPGRAAGIVPRLDFAAYAGAFARAADWIAAGDVYQVNLTFKADFELEGDAVGLYRDLCRRQKARYGALIATGEHTVLSRSPELFVSLAGRRLAARPMKGTATRGPRAGDDEAGRRALAADPKNRAENLMIVDLLRNDLARIARTGSVTVTDLFSVETYRTLHTMTSGIEAELAEGVGTAQLVETLFPCGSVTGAPKIRAMEIIDALESGPRGLYTGSIGWFAPSGDLCLSVAIRTAVIDAAGRGEIGIGGGVVADSTAESEYEEALLKMRFLDGAPLCLIETLLWTPEDGFVLIERHLDRLAASADYFGLACDREALRRLLEDWAATAPAGRWRVRLTLDEAEGAGLSATELPAPSDEPLRFVLAPEPVESTSVWLAHKTSNRAFLDGPRQRAAAEHGADEVVFRNERGELTEGSITTLFIERDGVLLTPPLSAGLLPGTLRAELIASGRAREARLTLADLDGAGAIYLGNSVRGLQRARWIATAEDKGKKDGR